MAHEVFICYASRDQAVAEAVCNALEARLVQCWIAPRDVLPGTEWAEAIVDALDESRVLVLVLSSSSNTSPQVIREVGRAASQGIPIIPIRIDDVAPSKALDFFVSSHHWLDAQREPLENHLQRLTDTVQQILTRRRTPQEVIEIAEAKEKAKREAEEARKAKEAEEKAKREAELAAKEKERREAEEARKAKEAEEKAKREAEEKAKAARPVTYCPKCGVELRPNTSFCHKCGTLVSEGAKAREAEEAEEKAKREAEEAKKAKEAEEKAKREAEEKAKREAEEARKAKEAEEKAKREAEEKAKAARPVTYCPKCGVELRPNTSFCHKCGTLVSEGAKAREAEEAEEKAKREAEEAKERVPVSVERAAEPVKAWAYLLKRRWLLVGAAVLVVLIALFIFILVALGRGG